LPEAAPDVGARFGQLPTTPADAVAIPNVILPTRPWTFGPARPVTVEAMPVQNVEPLLPRPRVDPKSVRGRLELAVTIRTLPPTPDQMFRLETEAMLRERMRGEVEKALGIERFELPPGPSEATPLAVLVRPAPGLVEWVEPSYVCFGRLFFHQINAERYGWDLGPLHPVLSAGQFYLDILKWPYYLTAAPCRWYDCDTGWCLPGDPVPLRWHPLAVK
jgi:hypothetical protein